MSLRNIDRAAIPGLGFVEVAFVKMKIAAEPMQFGFGVAFTFIECRPGVQQSLPGLLSFSVMPQRDSQPGRVLGEQNAGSRCPAHSDPFPQ